MTNTARKSLNKKLILILMAALLALVLGMQVVYAPVFTAPKTNGGGNTDTTDSMNGVSVKYTQVDSGIGEEFDYRLTDQSVSAASQKATPAPSKKVDVIVSLEGTTMMDYAVANGMSVAQAAATDGGQKNLENLRYIRERAIEDLSEYIIEKRYDYSTVINAFSATVLYGDVAKIERNSRVKNVILSETYLAPESVTENYVDVYETGIFNSEGIGYDGTGTVVAVVDTGTDYTHEVFNMELDADTLAISKDDVKAVAPALAATSLSALKGDSINEDDLYISSKLPYAYDYADSDANVYPHESHGTHVAGIIAGKSNTITGVAPRAQIATIKVFSDYNSGAKTEWIMAGLNDAVALGVDAINMSLGSSCGFSREVDEELINKVYDSINDAGICLVVAASNDASSAQNSTWGNSNLATNPDSGTVGSPGSYNAALSVGSVSGVKTKYFIAGGKEVYFNESRMVGKTDANDFVAELLGDADEGEFEYIVIPGIGQDNNYTEDVKDKIVVVKRGTNSFEEKIRTASEKGARGIIVYNNVSGTISMSVGRKYLIPSCFVTMDLSQEMVAAGRGVIKLSKSYLAGPFMSDFSSWGCLPNLILAPDITAHGGEINSAIPGGDQYDRMSGTSMACPNLAGALILVREFVKEKERQASTIAIRDESYSRMMSTATIVKNEEGNPYSPRKQGAGIADISHSINTKAYLTVDGLNKPKLSLGDDPARTGKYELKFNLVNDSNSAISYSLDQYVMTEGISADKYTVSEKAHLFNDTVNTYQVNATRGNAKLNGNTLSLSGYGKAEITVTIMLSADDKQYLDDKFVNGMFVEGYVMLKSRNMDGIDLNIPYLAFYGDWADAPMLDVSEYEIGESAVDDSILEEEKLKADVHGTLPYSGFYSPWSSDNIGYFGMGAYAYNIADGYATPVTQEKFAALTNNSDGDYMLYMINAGLLRCAKRVEMEIRNSATGELIWSGVDYNSRKSHSSGGNQTGGLILIELDIRELNLPNNAKYTFNMICYLDWKKDNSYITDYSDQADKVEEYIYGNKNTFSFEFTVDDEAPQLTNAVVRKTVTNQNINRYTLELSLFDNHYVQGFGVYTYSGKETINGYERYTDVTSLKNGLIPANGEFNTDNICSLDISGYWDKIQANGGKLYVNVYDYAKNSSSFELVISEIGDDSANPDADMIVQPKDDLTIAKKRNVRDDYTLKTYEQLDFSTLLTISANINDKNDLAAVYQEGYWMKNLKWTVDDPTVADVTDEGVVTGLKAGRTELTVLTPNVDSYNAQDTAHCLKFTIIVTEQEVAGGLKISGVELSHTSLTLERGETATVSARIKPYNYEGKVSIKWSIVPQKGVLSMEVSEDGMSVEVRALKSGSASIQAGVDGVYLSGYCSVTVLKEFTVTENIYMRSYTGRGGDWVNENGEVEHNVVVFDDDINVSIIYPSAFYGNEYIEKVIIPEGITSIMRATFFNCSNLKEVVLPESCTSIDYLAFANCNKLEKINLENVQSIGDSAFWGCAMEELNLAKCTYIDKYAFRYCQKLKTLDLSRVGSIGGGAFSNCSGLESVIIPENTSMSYDTLYLDNEDYSINCGGAFAFCTNLKSVIIKSRTVGESAFYACINLESVIFENDVDVIGVNAFAHCYALNSVKFYGSAYKIDNLAFLMCTSLKEITLPDGLSILGGNVFAGCKMLSTVKISSGALLDTVYYGSLGGLDIAEFIVENGNRYLSSEDGVLYDKAKKKLIAYPGGKVPAGAYNYTDYKFTVPDSVKIIGESAFAGVKTLYDVDLNNVEYIEAYAFSDFKLEWTYNGTTYYPYAIITAKNVKYIGDMAFYGSILSSLPLTNNTAHIGNGAFLAVRISHGDYGLSNRTLNIPANLKYLGDSAFAGAPATLISGESTVISMGFTKVNFATSSIKSVGEGAFAYNPELTAIDFGNLEAISDNMFADCAWTTENDDETETVKGLKQIVIPDTVKTIGSGAFSGCYLLENVTLSSKLTVIADNAFSGTAITNIVLPEGITAIGYGAFENSKLSSITLPAATAVIGNRAFAGTPLTEVKYASGDGAVVAIGNSAFRDCAELTMAKFPNAETIGNAAFYGCTSLGQVELSAVKTIGNDAFAGCEALTSVTLSNAEKIGARAFSGAAGLATISIPNIKTIGAEAFSGTAITAITLPEGFQTAEDKAFYGAEKLAAISVADGNKKYKSLDGVLYCVYDNGMYALVSYPAGKTDKTDYSVYDKTIKLNAYAFNSNKTLESVTLPVYLQVIGISAMNGMSSLTSLTINAVSAPRLESYAKWVYPEDGEGDASGSGSSDDDKVGNDDVENDNELVDRNDGVFTNTYDNFNFPIDEAGAEQQLKIYVPYNGSGYDGRIWKQYVGKCIVVSDKIHITLGTLQLIENIQAELDKTTHDASEVLRLTNIFNVLNDAQQQFILGSYDYEEKDENGNTIATIDKKYYNDMLKGKNFYQELTSLQSRAANASSVADDAQYSVISAIVDNGAVVALAVVATITVVIAVSAVTLVVKRRGK